MKNSRICTFTVLFSTSLLLVSCGNMNAPLGDAAYNPLDPPGGDTGMRDPYGPAFTPGSYLQTVSPSTAFFNKFPGTEDQPDKILPDYTDVKVISTKGSYVKVEVTNTGDVGFVPSVMLGEKRSPDEIPVTSGLAGPDATPDITPDPGVPAVAPDPEIPGIQPPELIDPSRPAE